MKVAKSTVDYRRATDQKKRCDSCCMFEPPDDCSYVAGKIRPQDTCNEWEAPEPTVYIVRHGSTAENRGGPGKDKLRGHTNIPMDEKGIREVNKSADLLAHIAIPVIYASDLQRARKTAEIVASKQGQRPPITFTPRLRTWDLGDELEGKLTTPAVLNRVKDFIRNDQRVPPGGESFSYYIKRILGYLEPLFDMVERKGGIICICTHGRTAQVVDLWVASRCDEACMRRDYRDLLADEPDVLHPGGVARYEFERGRWRGTEIPEGVPTPGTKLLTTGKVPRGRSAITS